jgi:hypothetical protein
LSLNIGLTTFSAVLSFAIELEGEIAKFYESAAPIAADLTETFENYARKSTKRRQRLIAIRQDNVTEIVLEPISGLDSSDYAISATLPSDRQAALTQALAIEVRVKQFYQDAGAKLNVTEPQRAFQKMAQESVERLAELKALQG